MDLLSETNLNTLEEIIQSVCPVLNDRVDQFEASQGKLQKIYTDWRQNVKIERKQILMNRTGLARCKPIKT